MNGPEHYREAEKLTAQADTVDPEFARYLLAKAQVHATLALTAATAANDAETGKSSEQCIAWGKAMGDIR